MVLWMRRETLAKCFCRWYWNSTALRRLRDLVYRVRLVVVVKALRSWNSNATQLRAVRKFVLHKAEDAVAHAFLVWCETVAERRRDRHRLASSRLWSARRRNRSC